VSAPSRKPAALHFGHPPETLRFWKRLVREALGLSGSTPLYVFSALPVAGRIAELDAAFATAGFHSALRAPRSAFPSVRHWLSCKTQPIRPLLRWWRKRGGDIEVVSEFELRAALAEGFAPGRILVNGPAKHHWLPMLPLRGLSVNFDSAAELAALLPLAKKLTWRVGPGESQAADAVWFHARRGSCCAQEPEARGRRAADRSLPPAHECGVAGGLRAGDLGGGAGVPCGARQPEVSGCRWWTAAGAYPLARRWNF
jgi:hypothetical protein